MNSLGGVSFLRHQRWLADGLDLCRPLIFNKCQPLNADGQPSDTQLHTALNRLSLKDARGRAD